MTEVEQALLLPTETDVVIRICEIIWSKIEKANDSLLNLTEPERIFAYVQMLDGQVNNGGFDQFFFNYSGEYAHEILFACEKIKAFKTASLVKTAIENFPLLPVPKDTTLRRKLMENLDEKISFEWDKLDTKFYQNEENPEELLINFVKAHIEAFS